MIIQREIRAAEQKREKQSNRPTKAAKKNRTKKIKKTVASVGWNLYLKSRPIFAEICADRSGTLQHIHICVSVVLRTYRGYMLP